MKLLKQLGGARTLDQALGMIIDHLKADSGSIHLMKDGALHLAASQGIPDVVLNMVRTVPVGKGMAGLAAQRRECVTVCNLQTDTSGDVRPGAKKTGMEGAIASPIFAPPREGESEGEVVGVLGIANRNERTFSDAEQELLVECGKAIVREHQP